MEARYLRQQAKQGPNNCFHFESDRITLNVPQGGTQENLNGWTIIPLNAPVVSYSYIATCTMLILL